MRNRTFTLIAWIVAIAIAILSVIISSSVGDKSYIIASVVIVLCAVFPVFAIFEHKKPQAKEIVIIATMCALSVIARIAFAALPPNFKPMAGIVMISGMALGTGPGFLVGAISMLLSDLFFGMGPWVPWQMLSFGACGAFAGLLAKILHISDGRWSLQKRFLTSIICGLFILIIAGPILDTSTLFYMVSSINLEAIITVYTVGIPVNATHALATFLTILVIAPPLLRKFSYIRKRYDLL